MSIVVDEVISVVYSKLTIDHMTLFVNAMEPPEIAVLLTNLKVTEIVWLLLRILIVMCALATNESAVSEFSNALRIYNDYISYVTLKWNIDMPQHF